MSRKILETSKNFLEIARNVLEISRKFSEISMKFLDTSRNFLDISRKFLEFGRPGSSTFGLNGTQGLYARFGSTKASGGTLAKWWSAGSVTCKMRAAARARSDRRLKKKSGRAGGAARGRWRIGRGGVSGAEL